VFQAERIVFQARAMAENKEIRLSRLQLPDGENFVMFDIEGMPPYLDEQDKVYLWGAQVFGREPSSYQAAVAGFEVEGDRQGWLDFLEQCKTIFDSYGTVPFVHWYNYEEVKLRQYHDRYGDEDGVGDYVRRNLVDLLPVTRAAVVLPESSYSLKVVEQRVGCKRRLEEYGGDWSMARYIEATETGDEAERRKIMQEILDYNREDLESTWAVFRWLRKIT
jgi:predicted RecB family nuclease